MEKIPDFYFEKMSQGQMADKMLSEKYSVSVNKVREQFIAYNRNKKWYRKILIHFKDVWNIKLINRLIKKWLK